MNLLQLSFARLGMSLIMFTLLATPGFAALPVQDADGQKLPSLAPMLERVLPAVVNIATTGTVQVKESPLLSDPFFQRFFDLPSRPRVRKTQSLGSGVVVDAKQGFIITNVHVIDKADQIQVTLHDGTALNAKVVGADPDTDVAVIQVQADGLQAIPFAKPDSIRVGDFVVAIGNPFGLGQTVTSGIVSAVGRSGLGIEGYEDFIQTDASINPGNSGGALVNLRGELVGINTAIFSESGGNIGIGFAIPVRMAGDIMQQLVKYGEVQRGVLGASAQDLTPQLARAFGIDPRQNGAVVTQVVTGSAAEHAGLRPGDIITRINGRAVRDANTLRNRIGLLKIGDEVTLKIVREGKTKTLSAKIQERHQTASAGDKLHPRLAGATFENIDPDSRLHGRVQGVLVSEVQPGSAAASTGLRPGDVITSANRKRVTNIGQLTKAVGKSSSLLLNLQRGNAALFVYLQ
jgi:serine protease Do/serine protease DegQ